MKRLGFEESIGHAATKIAGDVKANCIVSVEKIEKEDFDENPLLLEVKVTLFKQIKEGIFKKYEYETKIRKLPYGSIAPIKELLMEAITKKYVSEGDRVVCVQDETLGSGFKGLIFIIDIDKIFFDISKQKLAANIDSEVIEATINIAQEIANEGREGKKIGTSFIIGEKIDILPRIKQMIINPFAGYSSKLKITDPEIKETIKNFAMLDGAFIIDTDGSILTAGSYINVDTDKIDLPGFGSRHRSAAAITKETSAVAVVVSESGGIVRVFKDGKISMKI